MYKMQDFIKETLNNNGKVEYQIGKSQMHNLVYLNLKKNVKFC